MPAARPPATPSCGFDLRKFQAGDAAENIRVEDQDVIFIPKAHAYFVLGEVKSAGTFPLDKPLSVLEAVTLAGGFNDRAAPSGVKLIRRAANGEQESVSLDLARPGSRTGRWPCRRATRLRAEGQYLLRLRRGQKPGAYQLDRDTSILEGITIAGGFTDKAAPGRARVIRTTDGPRRSRRGHERHHQAGPAGPRLPAPGE